MIGPALTSDTGRQSQGVGDIANKRPEQAAIGVQRDRLFTSIQLSDQSRNHMCWVGSSLTA